ncbi:MAG: sigma-B regulation protein RsbU (phosphoserine phosphatase), partial [Candidatus Marinamargulisbacteria bacterium]
MFANYGVAKTLSIPIVSLSKQAQSFGEGDLDTPLQLSGASELEKLADVLDETRQKLKMYILEMVEKKKIETELSIAKKIQMNILPDRNSYKDIKDIQLSTHLESAKDVGGDFYDVFSVGELLYFVLGDVSGKGVPAALLMAVTKTIVKAIASRQLSPSEILTQSNIELSMNNDEMMFVTIFIAVYDKSKQRLTFCSAGHPPPYLISGDQVTELETTPCAALGVVPDQAYASKEISFEQGQSLFIFSDGVTEAMNVEDELFSEARVIAALEKTSHQSAATITANMVAEVAKFTTGAPPSDDITIF